MPVIPVMPVMPVFPRCHANGGRQGQLTVGGEPRITVGGADLPELSKLAPASSRLDDVFEVTQRAQSDSFSALVGSSSVEVDLG